MSELRQKLPLGFGRLLIIIMIFGVQSVLPLTESREPIDVILRKNYRSVLACQQMKEALEHIDREMLFNLLGYAKQGEDLISKNESACGTALQ